ncbi:MAG: Hsp20/alpha crystallin family protein [Ilumatobacteraceae bacterium]
MKHGIVTKTEPTYRFPDLPDMRRWFDNLPAWFAPFEAMKLEERRTDDAYVVRAELPGIDPDADADVWIADGMLHIKAERTQEQREEKADTVRSEFSYGSFHRAVTLPKGAAADDVKATYKDGVLEVRVPIRAADEAVAKVPISRT